MGTMAPGRRILRAFFHGPDLSGNARRTYRFHLAYAVLDAAGGGILLNGPIIALKAFAAHNWHLPIRELYSGLGMILTLYLGSWMARRKKMPFVFVPGVLAAASAVTMATAAGSPFWFLTLLGIGAMFEIVTRPAVTAILRVNYPVQQRGHATGQIRKWSSLSFLASNLLSAWVFQLAAGYVEAGPKADPRALADGVWPWTAAHMPQVMMLLAGTLSLSSFLLFRQIRVAEDPERQRRDLKPEIRQSFRDALRVVMRDGRYRRYLAACFMDSFSQMLYFSLIWAFLSRGLGFGYVGSSILMHSLPALVAFLATGALGHLIDRSNPWVAWGWVRLAYATDALLLAATPYYALLFAPALVILPVLGRVVRGSVQGAWWIMWWQIGVTHFAPPGEDTSRYMGIMIFLAGTTRMAASAAAMVLAALLVPPGALLVLGGLGLLGAAGYSFAQAARERREHQPETMTDFETQFAPPAP